MKIYVTYLRDEAGYHRYFHGSKAEAKAYIRHQRENPDPNNRPDAGEPMEDIDLELVPTDKRELLRWLNRKCQNAATF